jgi:NitT/TauT family transport system substrate-binding protein
VSDLKSASGLLRPHDFLGCGAFRRCHQDGFKEDGIEVTLVPLAGSSDCVKSITTKEIPFALAAVEPKAVARLQGIKTKTFYTAYQGNIYQLAVPADSPIHTIRDLRGKTIGVISLGGGVLYAKAVIAMAGLDPEKDVKFAVAGEGAQTAAMVRSKQVDAQPVRCAVRAGGECWH